MARKLVTRGRVNHVIPANLVRIVDQDLPGVSSAQVVVFGAHKLLVDTAANCPKASSTAPPFHLHTATEIPHMHSFPGNSAASAQFPHSCVCERFI
jgi:hypothetical protein